MVLRRGDALGGWSSVSRSTSSAPRSASRSSLRAIANGARSSTTARTRRRAASRPPAGAAGSSVVRPRFVAEYSQPCGPAKSTSLRAARAGVSRSRASSSMRVQLASVMGANSRSRWLMTLLLSSRRCQARGWRRRPRAPRMPLPRLPRRARRCRPLEQDALGDLAPEGVRRSRNSRSMQKCLNSSPCALLMIASASRSDSTAMRCSYQPIASASSVSEVHRRANVRVSAGSSPGGSWYWSNPM